MNYTLTKAHPNCALCIMNCALSKLSAYLFLEVCDDFVHHCIDLLILQGLHIILQNDADGIRLLACLKVLTTFWISA